MLLNILQGRKQPPSPAHHQVPYVHSAENKEPACGGLRVMRSYRGGLSRATLPIGELLCQEGRATRSLRQVRTFKGPDKQLVSSARLRGQLQTRRLLDTLLVS